jgi:hypothetical protein
MNDRSKKIDIYLNGECVCSSIRYRTIKQACEGFRNNPSWAGLRPDGSLGMVTHTFGCFDSVAAWWSDRQ